MRNIAKFRYIKGFVLITALLITALLLMKIGNICTGVPWGKGKKQKEQKLENSILETFPAHQPQGGCCPRTPCRSPGQAMLDPFPENQNQGHGSDLSSTKYFKSHATLQWNHSFTTHNLIFYFVKDLSIVSGQNLECNVIYQNF